MTGVLWGKADAYDPYVGRWSRLVAREFLRWLKPPKDGTWLDVGCGTGQLTLVAVEDASVKHIVGIDPSQAYIEQARRRVDGPVATFEVGDAESLPFEGTTFDCVVSGLVLNFVAHPAVGLAEMRRVCRPGGIVASYVWDYSGRMELLRHFWDAAVALDTRATELDEGRRFPLANPTVLATLLRDAGLRDVETLGIEVPTIFSDFDDYWSPFLGGQGPAPSYLMSLDEERRTRLRDRLRARLPLGNDGSISLVARAWAARGTV
jgi:SAM-dependent methyltransferase